jgi:hypothetical protein
MNVAELQFLNVLDDINGAMQKQAALARSAGPQGMQIDQQITAVKHLSLAQKELIGITQDLRKVEDAFSEAMKGDFSALESMTQSVGQIGEQFAQAIGGTKAAAAVKGAYDAALAIEYMAQFIASYGTDVDALLASVQYGLAAEEMFKVAGGGGGSKASRGGGAGGSQSTYGRSGGGGRGGSGGSGGEGVPGGGGAGTTFHMHIEGLISPDNLAQVMTQMTQLAKGGQATLGASYAMTNQGRLT